MRQTVSIFISEEKSGGGEKKEGEQVSSFRFQGQTLKPCFLLETQKPGPRDSRIFDGRRNSNSGFQTFWVLKGKKGPVGHLPYNSGRRSTGDADPPA